MLGKANVGGNSNLILQISCVDEDKVQMTNITIKIIDIESGGIYKESLYNGIPLRFILQEGRQYEVICSDFIASEERSGRYVTPQSQIITAGYNHELIFIYVKCIVYGFRIDSSIEVPYSSVTYLEDAVGMTPAYMNFNTGKFYWCEEGQEETSWENAFFMPRPCMLKYDGTVDYYLDPDNYAKIAKEDQQEHGTESDIANSDYEGNAMMEWGKNGKKIWYKIVPDKEVDPTTKEIITKPDSGNVYISNAWDTDYIAWPFIDSNNNYIDHFYTPIYEGTIITTKDSAGTSVKRIRSLSGQAQTETTLSSKPNVVGERTLAKNNNTTDLIEWDIETLADRQLINLLLVLISKNIDTTRVFGWGRSATKKSSTGGSIGDFLETGTMNEKGLFYGTEITGSESTGVKVFGMENWWGNIGRFCLGYLGLGGKTGGSQYYKFTHGSIDGTTVSDYSLTSTKGYFQAEKSPSTQDETGADSGNISKMHFLSKYGLLPAECISVGSTGTYSTYYGDYYKHPDTEDGQVGVGSFGGNTCLGKEDGSKVNPPKNGAFNTNLRTVQTYKGVEQHSCISCKPLAKTNI